MIALQLLAAFIIFCLAMTPVIVFWLLMPTRKLFKKWEIE